MKFGLRRRHRRTIRLPGYDYTQAGVYFVTLVTFERECLFGAVVESETWLSDHGRLAAECWTDIPDHFPQVELGAYVIMPNHVHGIIILNERVSADDAAATPSSPDGRSATTAADANASAGRGTPWRAPTDRIEKFGHPVHGSLATIIRQYKSSLTRVIRHKYDDAPHRIWQRNYYEHVIRDEMDLQRITDYILNNPLHWDHDEENIP